MEIIRKKRKPRGITGVIAAVEGYGKTTSIAELPGMYMLDVDDGSYGLDCPIVKFNGTVAGMMALIHELKSDKCPADMQNFGIDTADMLVTMLTKDLCKRKHWSSMEEKDYGKCWGDFKPEWQDIVGGLKDVARTKGINVIYTLHISGDKTFTEKTTGKQWNRWMARLTPKCAEELYSSTDFYFSGIYDTQTMKQNTGRSKIDIAISEERIVYTEHSSDHDGKCRRFVVMPNGSSIPKSMTLDEFQKSLPGILEASTDKTAKPGDFVEPKDDEKPKHETTTKPAAEPSKSESPKEEATESERPEVVEFRKTLGQYDMSEDFIVGYPAVAKKFKERYGKSASEVPVDEWPKDFIEWIVRGITMEKIKA